MGMELSILYAEQQGYDGNCGGGGAAEAEAAMLAMAGEVMAS